MVGSLDGADRGSELGLVVGSIVGLIVVSDSGATWFDTASAPVPSPSVAMKTMASLVITITWKIFRFSSERL